MSWARLIVPLVLLSSAALPRLAAAAPVLDVKPASLDFVAPTGGESAPQALTISNSGNSTLNVSVLQLTGFDAGSFVFAPALKAPLAIAAGKSTAYMVTFKPGGAGQLTAQLSVFSDGGQDQVPLAGKAGSRVDTTPAHGEALDFGSLLVGGAGTMMAVKINNYSGSAIGIPSVKVHGGTPEAPLPTDAFTVDNAGPFSVPANGVRTVNVTFAPRAEMAYAAYLEVDISDNSRYPSIIPLTGSGIASQLSTAPDALTFGIVTVGKKGIPQFISIANGGGLSLSLTLTTDAPQYTVSPGTVTLRPGGKAELTVGFEPDKMGEFPASVIYSITGGTKIGSTSLYGQGEAAPVQPGQDAAAATPTPRGGCTLRGGAPGSSALGPAACLLLLASLLRHRRRPR